MPSRACLACRRVLPSDMFRHAAGGWGRTLRYACQDCEDQGVPPDVRLMILRLSKREHMRRVRNPWYAEAVRV